MRVAGHPIPADVVASAAAAAALAAPPASALAAAPPLPRPVAAFVVLVLSALVYPLGVSLVALYVFLALCTASFLTSCVWPSLLLARSLAETLPFARTAFSSPGGPVRRTVGAPLALVARLAFEAGHCTAVLGRVLTLPLRPALPSFYIAGLAKCGTTTLAAYLRREGARGGGAGRPRFVFPAGALLGAPPTTDGESKLLSFAGLAEAAAKETHFLTGALGGGRGAPSAALYRSFYPLFRGEAWWRWAFWRRALARRLLSSSSPPVTAAPAVVVVDATPTYAALPFVARRIRHLTPGARVAVVVRDPVDALVSAQGMLRSLGALPPSSAAGGWGLGEPTRVSGGGGDEGGDDDVEQAGGCSDDDLRFADLHAAAELWRELERLPVDAPIPEGIARRMCALPEKEGNGGWSGLGGACEAAKAGQRIAHLARVLGPENVMVVPFADLVESPERVVEDVAAFAAGGGRLAAMQGGKQQRGDGGGSIEAAASFKPLGARMSGGGGGKKEGAAAVHPSVRARLQRDAFFGSALLLGELTGVDPRVLLRRPGQPGRS